MNRLNIIHNKKDHIHRICRIRVVEKSVKKYFITKRTVQSVGTLTWGGNHLEHSFYQVIQTIFSNTDVNQTAAEMDPPKSLATHTTSVDPNSQKAARFNGLVGVVLQIWVIKADRNTFNNGRFWLQVCVPRHEITTFTTTEIIQTLQKCLCVGTFT